MRRSSLLRALLLGWSRTALGDGGLNGDLFLSRPRRQTGGTGEGRDQLPLPHRGACRDLHGTVEVPVRIGLEGVIGQCGAVVGETHQRARDRPAGGGLDAARHPDDVPRGRARRVRLQGDHRGTLIRKLNPRALCRGGALGVPGIGDDELLGA